MKVVRWRPAAALLAASLSVGCGDDGGAETGKGGGAGAGGAATGGGGSSGSQAGSTATPLPPIGADCAGGKQVEPFGCVKVCTGDRVIGTAEQLQALVAEKCVVLDGGLSFTAAPFGSFEGLETLRRVKRLQVGNMPTIANARGLDGLSQVELSVNFVFNHQLIDLTGLENLTQIGGFLSISENQKFQSLRQLEKLSFVGESLSISGNPPLAQCEVDSLAARLQVGCGVVAGTFCSGNDGTQPCP